MQPPYLADTIAAVATASGPGAVAIVRLSGVGALDVARRVLRTRAGSAMRASFFESHRARVAQFVDTRTGGENVRHAVLDEVLVLPMRAPRSYTGEDIVEIHCHGGGMPRLVLAGCLSAGARMARAGEFTERAFLNGRLDLARAEAVAALVSARTAEAARAASNQLAGALSEQLSLWREQLLEARALTEVSLDFSDEDLPAALEKDLARDLGILGASVSGLAATWEAGRRLRDGASVVLLGRPNVGKSSLFNALLGRPRALVAAEPGTTRDWIEEEVEMGGVAVLLRDTAGVRTAAEGVEEAGIQRSLELAASADLVLLLLDGSNPLDANDRVLLEASQKLPCFLVWTKADLPADVSARESLGLPVAAGASARQTLGLPVAGEVSALSGLGLDPLRGQITAHLLRSTERDGLIVLHERHAIALERAVKHLNFAQGILESGRDLELCAIELGSAMAALDEILGRCDVEDLLDRVFSRFCIGK